MRLIFSYASIVADTVVGRPWLMVMPMTMLIVDVISIKMANPVGVFAPSCDLVMTLSLVLTLGECLDIICDSVPELHVVGESAFHWHPAVNILLPAEMTALMVGAPVLSALLGGGNRCRINSGAGVLHLRVMFWYMAI